MLPQNLGFWQLITISSEKNDWWSYISVLPSKSPHWLVHYISLFQFVLNQYVQLLLAVLFLPLANPERLLCPPAWR